MSALLIFVHYFHIFILVLIAQVVELCPCPRRHCPIPFHDPLKYNTSWPKKMTKHGEPCRLAGMVFVPLEVETLGGWEERGEKQIKRIGAALARQTGQDEAVKTRHLFQRLSILLTKGNAALFLNRLPSHPSPDIDGEQ